MTSLKFLAQLNNMYKNSPLIPQSLQLTPGANPLALPIIPGANPLGLPIIPGANPLGLPIIAPSVIQYQNVNTDTNLRTDVTKFFNKKVIKYITENSELNHLKKELSFLKSSDGWKFIYKLLRRFVKNSNINWYDLRDNYKTVRDYIINKL
jgi:hypothetical protein